MKKYSPLNTYLRNLEIDEWHANFQGIEKILGTHLPSSARKYSAWWANDSSSSRHANAWLEAGWETSEVNLSAENVLFRRTGRSKRKPRKRRSKSFSAATSKKQRKKEYRVVRKEESTSLHLSFVWSQIGDVKLDSSGRLVFPRAPKQPGFYRFLFKGGKEDAVYVGEAKDLKRRFQNYRTPGPTQQTSLRLGKELRENIKRDVRVSVAIVVDGAWFKSAKGRRGTDLSHKIERMLFEHAALALYRRSGIKVLNK